MESRKIEHRKVIARLVPFFLSVGLYFIILIPYEKPSFFAVVIKCTPIVTLMVFVRKSTNRSSVFMGLLCCCIGDALLIFNEYFIYGMIAFILGHINYIVAFGFRPLRVKQGLFFVILGAVSIALLYEGLENMLLIAVPIYILVIGVMVWRSSARIEEKWTWVQLGTCLGSILFATSDLIIGIDKFIKPIAHSQVLVMSLYYAAQLGISLLVLEAN